MVKDFINHLKFEKRYSKHTLVSYETDLSQAEGYSTSEYDVDLLGSSHLIIRSWIVSLIESGISTRSINRKISSLKAYYKFLKRNKKIENNPMVKIVSPKTEKRLPQYIREDDMSKLFSYDLFEDDYSGQRDRLLIELFYLTGMRLSELINIKPIDIANDAVKVLGKRNKERIIPLNAKISSELKRLEELNGDNFNEREPFLFLTDSGKKLYEKFVYRKVNHYLSVVTSQSKKSPHVLRHSFATHMLNNGAELNAIKEILGHANLSATQVYTHNSIDKLKNVYQQAHPRS